MVEQRRKNEDEIKGKKWRIKRGEKKREEGREEIAVGRKNEDEIKGKKWRIKRGEKKREEGREEIAEWLEVRRNEMRRETR